MMTHKHIRLVVTAVGLALFLGGIFPARFASARQVLQIETPAAQQGDSGPLGQAIQTELTSIQNSLPALRDARAVIDAVRTSTDNRSALIYLALQDPATGEILGGEPLLAVAQNSTGLENGWEVVVQGDPGFTAALRALPSSLVDPELRQRLLETSTADPKAIGTTYGGYLLPWAAGVEKRLSMGANHVSCPTTCTYAFDFADGTMFPLLASKGGSVYHWKDSCPNGGTSCTNSITIEDRSTTPWTYQIYLHLAQNSIPAALKAQYTPVVQGQYIGNVDDTGYSSGHHVHFMVITNPVLGYSGYMWGTSVDITFRDVNINWDPETGGGRPCLYSDWGYGHCNQYQQKYISGNVGSNPPTGGLTGPAFGTSVSTRTVSVSGWGQDDLRVTKLQMLANYDGTWREVGTGQTTTPFTYDLDLCQDQIPNGPVSLALRVYDYEGNFTLVPLDPRPILKNYICPAPPPTTTSCIPGTGQVALFSEPDFGGVCELFGEGSYATGSTLGRVGADNTASIKVGQNVSASLFWGENFGLRSETFTSSYPTPTLLDRNLADNLTGTNTLSSLKVEFRNVAPPAPTLYMASSTKQVNTNPKSTDSIVLSWTGAGGSTKYLAELYSDSTSGTLMGRYGFTTDQSWSIGSLPAGTYVWQVRGRVADYGVSPLTYLSPWSTATFTVDAASLPDQVALGTPYTDQVENGVNGWSATGLWRQGQLTVPGGTTTAWIFNNNRDYADSTIRAGDLTSPPITLPAAPAIRYLRFDYQSRTESSQVYFDQRRVQISVDGGSFRDLLSQPLNDDAMDAWLQSGPISLAAYAGRTVRLRFHFDIVDPNWNNYSGWAVDNITINDQPGAPIESPVNSSPANAPALSYNSPLTSAISPQGDVDFYRITANAGEVIQVDVVAGGLSPASPLDPIIALVDADGRSILAENDDISPGYNSDSRLTYLIRETGTYYIKVKAWNHPGAGGPEYVYRITAAQVLDTAAPSVSLINVQTGGSIPAVPFTLSASAVDGTGGSGIQQVQFFLHTGDWANGTWQLLGSDATPADGWKLAYDPSGLVAGQKYSFFARADDLAGNSGAAVAWDVAVDPNLVIEEHKFYFPIIWK